MELDTQAIERGNTYPPLHLHPLLPEADLAQVVLERVHQQVVSAVGTQLRGRKDMVSSGPTRAWNMRYEKLLRKKMANNNYYYIII